MEFKPNLEDIEEINLNISMITQHFSDIIKKKEEEIFTFALRTTAEPPINGKITSGKITWRGIKRISQQTGFITCSWLEQRGKRISPKICTKMTFADLNKE